MTDIRINQKIRPFEITLDWLLTPAHMLDESQELATAVIVALGTDRLADADEILPDPDSTDRRGWWGDIDARIIWDGWPIGSRTWLLARSKIVGPESIEGATLARAEWYVREALQPFIDHRIASAIDVAAERRGRDTVVVSATIYRGPLPAIDLMFQLLWDEQSGTLAITH